MVNCQLIGNKTKNKNNNRSSNVYCRQARNLVFDTPYFWYATYKSSFITFNNNTLSDFNISGRNCVNGCRCLPNSATTEHFNRLRRIEIMWKSWQILAWFTNRFVFDCTQDTVTVSKRISKIVCVIKRERNRGKASYQHLFKYTQFPSSL